MHIETDPELLVDPLWSALDGCIVRFQEDPYRILYEKKPDYSGGLNAAEINRLVADAKLSTERSVFGVRGSPGKTDEVWLDVFHPDRPDPISWKTWSRGFLRSLPPAKLDRTKVYLEAWRNKRAEQLAGGHGGKAKESDKPKQPPGGRAPRGSADDVILAMLSQWHRYDATSIGNNEPIGVRQMYKEFSEPGKMMPSFGTVSKWFKKHFGNHKAYEVQCCNGKLLHTLKTLSGDYSTSELISDTRQLAEEGSSE